MNERWVSAAASMSVFVPWRFSDAGKQRAQLKRRDAASEKPAQKATFVLSATPIDFAGPRR